MTQIDVYRFKQEFKKNLNDLNNERKVFTPTQIKDDNSVNDMFDFKNNVLHAKCNFESVVRQFERFIRSEQITQMQQLDQYQHHLSLPKINKDGDSSMRLSENYL